MTTVWYTSDLHLGHANIIKYCNRPFEDVEEMDEILIKNWNKVVKTGDIVYHVGDFCFRTPEHYIKKLNGKIVFIRGSHDKIIESLLYKDSVVITKPVMDEYGNPRPLVMSHYAMRSWSMSHYASWHIFGHHHGKLEPYGLSFDVGVDCWDYYPITIQEIAEKMATLKPLADFRKG